MTVNNNEEWWDDLIAAERFAVYKFDGKLNVALHHDFDDSSIELHTIDDVLYRIRQALEKGMGVTINLENKS
ncbi:hypothetical protein [Stenotrophomonas sp. SG1]|uniref:hypothetical protein n=1 Tax=Stenotrophomonas sp. SG1 TaxID=2944932 RepID=UPI00224390F6|nr:hypothetical protein [Stenotrophomonas sp. SG1]MCW8340613.1 hypothetical protein [Stenotrophomonas sp. SG1]